MRADIPSVPDEGVRKRREAVLRFQHADQTRRQAYWLTLAVIEAPDKAEAHRLAWQAHMGAAFVHKQLGNDDLHAEHVAQSEMHYKQTHQYAASILGQQ